MTKIIAVLCLVVVGATVPTAANTGSPPPQAPAAGAKDGDPTLYLRVDDLVLKATGDRR
jgi:hypothetical protein